MIRQTLLTLATLTLFLIVAPPAAQDAAEEFNYHKYDAALKQATEEKKMVMVFFWADWCGFCSQVRQEVFRDPKIKQIFEENFVAVSVDVEHDPTNLAKKYHARTLPTLAFLKPDGEIVAFWEGATDQVTFLKILNHMTKEIKS
ncbi:MAG: hypothetical protein AMR96_01315 [Candidatus Adiutrix intracellularis]|jgi:thioredoxin-related protein|nr:MAG: hypothetical protein AMR96_01315 [Candidatus Adiutrix intracellularis]MDR2827549.1 thioredoxin family protein [Candidatus Adiutrix intracellularis]